MTPRPDCTAAMIRWTSLLFHNWRAKLGSLALAIVLWLVIRRSVQYAPSLPTPLNPPPTEAAPRE